LILTHKQAIGIAPGSNGGVTLLTKKAGKGNKPGSGTQSSTFGTGSSSRSNYSKIVNSTASKGYRADLRSNAVKRASAVSKSQKPAKKDHPVKLRGAKAKKAAAAESS
jgi:large subunit ribosomal protein L28e